MSSGRYNWHLIQEHQAYIDTWKGQIINQILNTFDRLKYTKPAVYACGYNYEKAKYEESYNPIDPDVLSSIASKIKLYERIHNIEAFLPFQPLACILTTDLTLQFTRNVGQEDEWIETVSSVIIWFQTRLSTKRYIYRKEDGKLIREHGMEERDLGPEINTFDHSFAITNSKN